MKEILKKLTPPIILDILRKPPSHGFFGNYQNWQLALNNSTGYDNPAILEKVKDSMLKVKSDETVFERDSVILDKAQYPWPLLSTLLLAGLENNNELQVIDFGGSLGSTFFQVRKFLKHFKLKWQIIEQNNFVDCGK